MKKFLFTLTLVGLALGMNAKPITPSEALNRLGGSSHKVAALSKTSPKLVHTAKTNSGNPAVYIFNQADNKGFMVLSADDQAYPVLGYADSGSFSADNIPPQMEWWLSEYAAQIEYAAGKQEPSLLSSLQEATRAQRSAIPPMISAKWDQGAPYNEQCPMVAAEHGYTGCVATAMAQVMDYFQYPEVGEGQITYTSESIAKRLTINFANKKFDWDNMCDTYLNGQYTQEQADAVAYLMKACGYAVKMDYASDSSGALAMNIRRALTKYFKYDENMKYELRFYYNATQWEELIYNSLQQGCPVMYGGASYIGGGHSFVCDGYDGNGMFHFNWGWSGMCNGYFSLDALNPDALGTGGGGGGGYNFTQDAVVGIQPPTGLPVETQTSPMTQMGSLAASIEDDTLKFELFGESDCMFVNYNPETLKVKFGALFELQGDASASATYKDICDIEFDIQPGYGTSTDYMPGVALSDLASLADGTYKVTMVTRPYEEENAGYLEIKPCYGYFNYVTLKKEGSSFTVDSNPIVVLDLLDCEITNTLYYGGLCKTKIVVANDSDLELSKGFAPALIYVYKKDDGTTSSTLCFLGESIFLTVPPHSEIEKEWTTTLYELQSLDFSSAITFELGIFDETSYNFYIANDGNPVVMYPNPGVPSIEQIGTLRITNSTYKTELLPNNRFSQVYLIDDPANIQVATTLSLTSGTFCYNAMAFLTKPSFTSTSEETEILGMGTMPLFLESAGARSAFNATISYPTLEAGEYYAIVMGYQYGSSYVGLSGAAVYLRLNSDATAVEEIEESVMIDENSEIFNLQGISVGTDFESLPAGLYIRNGKKILKK